MDNKNISGSVQEGEQIFYDFYCKHKDAFSNRIECLKNRITNLFNLIDTNCGKEHYFNFYLQYDFKLHRISREEVLDAPQSGSIEHMEKIQQDLIQDMLQSIINFINPPQQSQKDSLTLYFYSKINTISEDNENILKFPEYGKNLEFSIFKMREGHLGFNKLEKLFNQVIFGVLPKPEEKLN